MSVNKRFFWLKLKEDFFEDDTIQWIEEQKNGKEYTLFYLKMCLKSLKTDGSLIRFVGENVIPYDMDFLAKITNTDIDTVVVAMELFKKIGLVAVYETGEIYINRIKEMAGSETDKAEAMRISRAKNKLGNNVTECYQNVNQSIEIEKEKKKEIDNASEIDADISEADKNKKKKQKELNEQQENDFEDIWNLYPKKQGKKEAKKHYLKAVKNGATKEDIKNGVIKYKKDLKLNNTEMKFVKNGSTYFSQETWLDVYDFEQKQKEENRVTPEQLFELERLENEKEAERRYGSKQNQ